MPDSFSINVFRGRAGDWKASVRGAWGYVVSAGAFQKAEAVRWAIAVESAATEHGGVLTPQESLRLADFAASLIADGGE